MSGEKSSYLKAELIFHAVKMFAKFDQKSFVHCIAQERSEVFEQYTLITNKVLVITWKGCPNFSRDITKDSYNTKGIPQKRNPATKGCHQPFSMLTSPV